MRNRLLLSAALLFSATAFSACSESSKDPEPSDCEVEPCVDPVPLDCAPGTFDDGVASTCQACPADHWCAGDDADPVPHTVCDDDEVETTAPNASTDRECGPPVACTDDQTTRVVHASVSGVSGANACCHLHVGDVTVEDNDGWPTFEEECLVVQGDVFITGTEADPVDLARVDGHLYVQDYDGTTLDVVSSVHHVTGTFTIHAANAISDLSGLSGLQVLERELYLSSIAGIENLSGLDSLHTLGGLTLQTGLSFTDYAGIPNVTVIGAQGFTIAGSSTMPADFTGLNHLGVIEGDFSIAEQENLSSLNGLDSLKVVVGTFLVNQAGALEDLQGMPALSEIRGGISIVNNPVLLTMHGLDAITTTEGQVNVGGNALIEDMTGLMNLAEVGGNLTIRGNARLCPVVAQAYLDDPMRQVDGNAIQTANGTEPGLVCP